MEGRQIQRLNSTINLAPQGPFSSYLKENGSGLYARSNSLPSRPHPVILRCNEHLDRLRASQEAPTSSSFLSKKLQGLRDLQDCVEKLVLLPQTQEAHLQEFQVEILDGSFRLLDVFIAAKDGLFHTKECTRA